MMIPVYEGVGMNRRAIGKKYEEIAIALLEEQGYHILEKNYSNTYGEIDIVAKEQDTLVFVEVKYRSSGSYGDALEAVDWKKQKRICRSALYYCSKKHGNLEIPCRFDVIAIYGGHKIVHIKNAFEC